MKKFPLIKNKFITFGALDYQAIHKHQKQPPIRRGLFFIRFAAEFSTN